MKKWFRKHKQKFVIAIVILLVLVLAGAPVLMFFA